MKHIIVILLLSLMSMGCCYNQKREALGERTIISCSELRRAGFTELTDKSLKIFCNGDFIYICSRNDCCVAKFNFNGELLRNYREKGNTRGKFLKPEIVFGYRGGVCFFDKERKKILFFDSFLNFLKEEGDSYRRLLLIGNYGWNYNYVIDNANKNMVIEWRDRSRNRNFR